MIRTHTRQMGDNDSGSLVTRLALSGAMAVLALALAACDSEPKPAAGPAVTLVDTPAGTTAQTPWLAVDADNRLVMTWVEEAGDASRLLLSVREEAGWRTPVEIASGEDWFVNWADFPAVAIQGDHWIAHWLAKVGDATYAYAVHAATSADAGRSWQPIGIVHQDDSAAEHGFVSYYDAGDAGIGTVWLDGAATADGGMMALKTAQVDAAGAVSGEQLLDDSVCDCCQTDAAVAAAGPVVAYRDRTAGELRDIAVVRQVDGVWTEPQLVADEQWQMPACPVNGPSISAADQRVAVAWFTGAEGQARVRVAFSDDGGASFGAPITIDDSDPMGRVDTVLLPDGSVAVSYLDQEETGTAVIRLARVDDQGEMSIEDIGQTSPARSSGFPRMTLRDGELWIAWREITDGSDRLRLGRMTAG